jgi:hypothetical protein
MSKEALKFVNNSRETDKSFVRDSSRSKKFADATMTAAIITAIVLMALVVTSLTGCSKVGFQSIPKLSCDKVTRDQNTACFAGASSITVTFSFGVGDVDILFIDDNSGSMFAEQKKMANAFPNFLSQISNLFYHIGIITTDVSASPGNTVSKAANGNTAFQDGKLLEFTDEQKNKSGLFVIDRNTPNVAGLFRGSIQRDESIACDAHGFSAAYCPSDDERGIYAANLAIKRGDKRFFRSGAHLAVVVLSDEDERSQGGTVAGSKPLELNDLPDTLVKNLAALYPTKSMSVHSIITNDQPCRSQQTQSSPNGIWPTLGFIGEQYKLLSAPSAGLMALGNIITGEVGSICAADYGAQLTSIGANIQTNTFGAPKQLACLPDPTTIHVVTSPTGFENQIAYSIDAQNKVVFSNLPIGVQVSFSYDCPKF